MEMLDVSKSRPLAIPEEMFEPKRGWRLYTPDELRNRSVATPGAGE